MSDVMVRLLLLMLLSLGSDHLFGAQSSKALIQMQQASISDSDEDFHAPPTRGVTMSPSMLSQRLSVTVSGTTSPGSSISALPHVHDMSRRSSIDSLASHVSTPSQSSVTSTQRSGSLNDYNNSGVKSLFSAIDNNRIGDVRTALVRMMRDNGDINAPFGEFRATALHYAVQLGRDQIVELLVCEYNLPGLNVNAQDKRGMTPLHYAARKGNGRIISALICTGELNPNVQNILGNTPLMDVLAFGEVSPNNREEDSKLEVVKELIKIKSDLNIQNNDRETAFTIAQNKNYQKIFQYLNDCRQFSRK